MKKIFPVIDKRETGIRLRRIMDLAGITPKEVQEYLGLGCVQSVYRWLNGQSMPTIDNLYALSELFQLPIDSLVCGNRRVRFNCGTNVFLDNQARRIYKYYERLLEHSAA